jgi:ATP-dependent helicase/nuclease subunit A
VAREFTQAQQQAITTQHRDICVVAGAGSGKTGVLVERFVRLVAPVNPASHEPAEVSQILVITFTDKATREMKSRIVDELTRLQRTEQRRQVETAYISTIHGFCSRLLQENPFEAGCDPQFTVLDEPHARRLLRQCTDAVVARAYGHGDADITELVAAAQAFRSHGDESGDPLGALSASVESAIGKLRGAGHSRETVLRHWQSGADEIEAKALAPVQALIAPVVTEVTACLDALRLLREGVLGAARVACDAVLQQADCLNQASTLMETFPVLEGLLKAVSRPRPRNTGMPQEITLTQVMQRLKIACEEVRDLYGVNAEREAQAQVHCHRLWKLICAVWEEYEEAKQERGVLDADDLQAQAAALLEGSPGVRERYRRRFKHLLIDEFQDTNAHQMRLIRLLHATPAANGTPQPAPNRLFVVGDVQQSIYGFRHADPRLFRNVERRFRERKAGEHISLSVNFRSRPEILQTIETVFRQVWREEATPFVPLSPGAIFDPKPTPSVELLLTQDLHRRDYIRLEAESLAARLQQLVEGEELRLTAATDPRRGQPVGYRDIAILLRGLTDIQKYEEAFARRGVPCFVVGGGRGYYARHEIRDLRNALTVLDTPLDDIALAATLRSPLFGIETDTLYRLSLQAGRQGEMEDTPATQESRLRQRPGRSPLYPAIPALLESNRLPDEEAQKLTRFLTLMEALRAQEDRLPVGHLLERLIAATQYDARLLVRPGGRRRLANVRKLLQMANADPVMGVRDFIRRLRDMEKLSDREGDAPTEEEAADVVRILTIHGAKGLEFPVVVLADLARGLLIPERGLFACDPNHLALGTRLGGAPSLVYRAIDKSRQEADRQEAARLLYVAMTRAREHLMLCGNLGRNWGYNWADNLFPILGILDVPPEPEVRPLAGNIAATVAPLAYYAHAPFRERPGSLASARRSADQLAERLAETFEETSVAYSLQVEQPPDPFPA